MREGDLADVLDPDGRVMRAIAATWWKIYLMGLITGVLGGLLGGVVLALVVGACPR